MPPLAVAPAKESARTLQILLVARQQIERVGSRLLQRDRVGIADFGAHSIQPRFHLVDLAAGTIHSYRVAHGTGSDPENDGWLGHFSNLPGSNSTSRGAYVTVGGPIRTHNNLLPLRGLDRSNSNALTRSLTLQASAYCSASYVEQRGRLGRSDGSLALAPDDFRWVEQKLSHGRLVFAERLSLI
jgi:hypothetical protein